MTVTDHGVRADVIVEAHGSLFLVTARSTEARDWITENVYDDALWFAGALVVEHSYIVPLIDGLHDAGMIVR